MTVADGKNGDAMPDEKALTRRRKEETRRAHHRRLA